MRLYFPLAQNNQTLSVVARLDRNRDTTRQVTTSERQSEESEQDHEVDGDDSDGDTEWMQLHFILFLLLVMSVLFACMGAIVGTCVIRLHFRRRRLVAVSVLMITTITTMHSSESRLGAFIYSF